MEEAAFILPRQLSGVNQPNHSHITALGTHVTCVSRSNCRRYGQLSLAVDGNALSGQRICYGSGLAQTSAAINRVAESILGGASPPVIPVTDEMFDTLHRRFDAGEVGVAAAGADGTRILLRLESGVIVGADSGCPAGSEVVSDTIIAVVPHIVAARQRARRL